MNEQGGRCQPVAGGSHLLVGSVTRTLPEVTIGDNAMIGAGSVVTWDLVPRAIVAGSPARILRFRDA
ncbi:MAG: hypothetical protein KGR25_09445 [Chloroflexi bacterium]|nr:hypothetical protein [Chloroflexota bacterium]